MTKQLYIEEILPFEQLRTQVPERDLLTAGRMRALRRREEFLTWRAVVYRHLPGVEIGYNAVGAPQLINRALHVSVSHCAGYVAVALSEKPCAVDIELLSRNFSRVASRFVTPDEARLAEDERLLAAIWCGKEALYKYAGRRQIDWLRDLRIESVDFACGRMVGRVAQEEPLTIELRFERGLCIASIF